MVELDRLMIFDLQTKRYPHKMWTQKSNMLPRECSAIYVYVYIITMHKRSNRARPMRERERERERDIKPIKM